MDRLTERPHATSVLGLHVGITAELKQEAQLPQRERASNIALSYSAKRHFDMLNRLGVDHECERQTDGWAERQTEAI